MSQCVGSAAGSAAGMCTGSAPPDRRAAKTTAAISCAPPDRRAAKTVAAISRLSAGRSSRVTGAVAWKAEAVATRAVLAASFWSLMTADCSSMGKVRPGVTRNKKQGFQTISKEPRIAKPAIAQSMKIRTASATRSWVGIPYFNCNCNCNYKGPFLLFSGVFPCGSPPPLSPPSFYMTPACFIT